MKKILFIALVALSSVAFAQDYVATSSIFLYLEPGMDSAKTLIKPTTITVEEESNIKVYWWNGDKSRFMFLNSFSDEGYPLFMDMDHHKVFEVYYEEQYKTWFIKREDQAYMFSIIVDNKYYNK